jgi:PKD repeat protein
VSTTVCENVAAGFSVDAGLTYSPSYQWQYHDGVNGWQNTVGANYSGSMDAALTINNPVSSMNGYAYRVIVSGYCAPQVISDSVILNIEENPEILLHPVNAMICENSDTSFTIDAGVTTDPVYTWYYDDGSGWTEITGDAVHSGHTSNTLELSSVPFSFDNYSYYVELSGKCGTPVSSGRADLYVMRRAEISEQPEDVSACELSNVTFDIATGQTDGVFIQWQVDENSGSWTNIFDGGNYTGSNSTELRVYSIDSAMNNYRYRAIVYGTCPDSAISDPASLEVYNAPDIWNHPEDETVCEGVDAGFEILATGNDLDISWQVDMNDGLGYRTFTDTAGVYSGAETTALTVISPDRTYQNYRYRAKAEGSCAPVSFSDFATLKINTPPEILDHPLSDTICEFTNISFSVNAQGTDLDYQWQENSEGTWTDLNDAGDYIGTTSPTMSIFNLPREKSGNLYRVEISGECPSPATSDAAEVFIKTSPVITAQPSDTTVCQDEPVEFSVSAEGSDLEYQWQLSTGGPFSNLGNDAVYSGVNTPTLAIASASPVFDNYRYRVVVSGSCVPAVNSNDVTLLIDEFPVVNVNPNAAEICEGGSTSFTGGAIGQDLSYQWEYNDGLGWTPVPEDGVHSGTTTTSLSIINAPVSISGNLYRLSIVSACKNIVTEEAELIVNENPTAGISGDGTFPFVCGGYELTLEGNPAGGSGNYVTHAWTGDIVALSNITQEQTTFSTVIHNEYDLTYTVTDDKGCKGSDNVTIENNMPNAQFSSDAYPACGELTVNFDNTSTRAISYEWNFDDGSPVDTTTSPSHGFDNLDPSGLVKYYNVQLVAESEKGCQDTATQFITIYPKVDPAFEITPDTACQPVVATLITQPGAANYTWDFGDGQQENGSYTMMHEFTNTSDEIKTYEVELTTTSFYGCVESATEEITVYPIPTPNFTVSPIQQTYPDATVVIDNLVREGPWEYEYDFGDGNISTDSDPTHTYAESGTYKIVQTVRAGECVDSINQTVVINPTPPVADFNLPESGCTPVQVQFENTSLYANSYVWEFGDGSISTKKDPIYTYFEAGTYAVTLTVRGPGGTDTYKQNIEIWASPNLFFNNAPDSVYVNDKPVKFFNYSSDATNYYWHFGDYDEDTGAESEQNDSEEFEPSHIYEFKGWKDVYMVGWNDHCRDTLVKEKAVYVSPAGSFRFPNVFRPNPYGPNGGVIDNLSPSEVNSVFFPGVADQVLEYNLYIYNRWGELIFESDNVNVGWDGYINGRLARQGVYVWKVKGKYTNGKNFVEVGDVTLLH